MVREVGSYGAGSYLPPLLSVDLVILAALALYEAALAGLQRPRWALAGLVLGCLVTLAMNVAAGWPYGPGGALVAALAPVVLFFALEILTGVLRRGRVSAPLSPAPAGAATCDHLPPMNISDAIRAAAPYQSERELAVNFERGKTTVHKKLRAPVPGGTKDAALTAPPGSPPLPPSGPLASVNGNGRVHA